MGCRRARGAYDVQDLLEAAGRSLAATTLLTVFSRLEGFVTSDRAVRPYRYSAVAPHGPHVAELMHEVLGGSRDRTAVLSAADQGSVSDADAVTLRQLLRAEDLRG